MNKATQLLLLITLLIITTSLSVTAAETNIAHNESLTNSGSVSNILSGINITIMAGGQAMNLSQIKRVSGATGNRAYLYDETGSTILANVSWSGDSAQFNNALIAGRTYWLITETLNRKGSGNPNSRVGSPPYLNWTNGLICGWTFNCAPDEFWNIESINVTFTTAPSSFGYNYSTTPNSPALYSPTSTTTFSIQYANVTGTILNATLFLKNSSGINQAYPLTYNTTSYYASITGLTPGNYNVTTLLINTTGSSWTTNHSNYLVNNLQVGDCQAGNPNLTSKIINATFYNLETSAKTNSTASVLINFYYSTQSNNITFSKAYTNTQNFGICTNTNEIIRATGSIQYQDVDLNFSANTYSLSDAIMNGTTNINLYLLTSTTPVTITVVDNTATPKSGIMIYAQTILPGTTTYVTVSSATTGYDGKATLNLKAYTYYKFVLYEGSTLSLTTSPIQITQSAYTFTISNADHNINDYNLVQSSNCNIQYDNTTASTIYEWSVPTGNVVHACLIIRRTDAYNNTIYSQTCTSSASGTITSGLNTTQGTYSSIGILSFGTAQLDPPLYMCGEELLIDFGGAGINTNISNNSGAKTTALFLSFMALCIAVGIGIWSPIASVLLGTGMILMLWLIGMISFGSATVTAGIVLIGAIVIYRMKYGYG